MPLKIYQEAFCIKRQAREGRDKILRHHFDTGREYFAPCYFKVLKIHTKNLQKKKTRVFSQIALGRTEK
jgi:hypothetical protein